MFDSLWFGYFDLLVTSVACCLLFGNFWYFTFDLFGLLCFGFVNFVLLVGFVDVWVGIISF